MLSKCSPFGKKNDVAQIEKKFLHVRRIGFQKKLSYSLPVYEVLIVLHYKNPSYNLSRPGKK